MVSLIIQINIWNEFSALPEFIMLVASISNWLFVEIQFTTYVCSMPWKYFMWYKNDQKISHGSQTWFKIHKITCEIDIANSIKVKNHFNFLGVYIYNKNYKYYFCTNKFLIYHDIHCNFFINSIFYHNLQKMWTFFNFDTLVYAQKHSPMKTLHVWFH